MMGLNVICLVAMVLITGVHGVVKVLYDDCTSADTCQDVTLELTCDAFAKKCLIKAGQLCSGSGHGVKCVTGAACTATMCTCGAVYANTAGICTLVENKYGGACPAAVPPAAATCTGTNLLCNSDTLCECDVDNKVDISTGFCVAIGQQEVGKACTTLNAATPAECGVETTTNLACSSLACACNAGYTGPVGGTCTAIAAAKIGKVCTVATTTADCGVEATTKLTCTSSLACACNTGYTGVMGGDCTPMINNVGGPCVAASCTATNAECTDSVCKCKINFVPVPATLTCTAGAGAVVISISLMFVAALSGLVSLA